MTQSDTAIVGCLIDVSNSMRTVLETGKGDGRATERLRAVLQAALKLARAEQRQNPNALMFIGAFGLKDDKAPVVDLCSLVDALLQGTNGPGDRRDGHDHLVALANTHNVPHVTKYIRERLTEAQARIVHIHLQRNPARIREFLNAIPPEGAVALGNIAQTAGNVTGFFFSSVGDFIKEKTNNAVDNSDALKLARRICDEWLNDFKDFVARRVSEVIPLLEKLENHPSLQSHSGNSTLLDDLRPHLYGWTPMRVAMTKALGLFRGYSTVEQRVLVMITDGESTDGDPLPIAKELKDAGVSIASVFLTADTSVPRRRLYDHSRESVYVGQTKLFDMASKIAVTQHPIPVLAATGWEVPSSGECALYATVCSSDALEEFCSLLLSARFGSADALLDIVGKVSLDKFINDAHMTTRKKPSKQTEPTCYAHADAAVLHMTLARIVGREGDFPTIEVIRKKILDHMPPLPGGRNTVEVMQAAMGWYRPLRFRAVDEDGARQAILRRRPVLATFRLSDDSWDTFSDYFQAPATRTSVLTKATMAQHSWQGDGGGHAVVLVKCDPKSLTFLNSWGHQWGDHGSFSIEDHTVLEPRGAPEWAHMNFFDVYWFESDLTAGERKAYAAKVDEEVRAKAAQHPSVLELEMRCPKCKGNAAIAKVTGNIREVVCPLCYQSFKPEPGHLVQAIYAKAGLGDVV